VQVKQALAEFYTQAEILLTADRDIHEFNYLVNNTGNTILSNVLLF